MKKRTKTERRGEPRAPSGGFERLYGVHTVSAALANPDRHVSALFATRNGLVRLAGLTERHSAAIAEISPAELTRKLGRDAVHQGVMAEARPLAQPSFEEILSVATRSRALLVLDQVTDPHNVGAILRSAAAFKAVAVVMTRRNSPPLDGVVAKAASGAVEHVPVVLVANLARALEDIGKAGIQRIGLDSSAPQTIEKLEITTPYTLVLGAEHKGLRRLTQEKCDLMCRLTTPGPLASMNVSNAAAVAMHALLDRTET